MGMQMYERVSYWVGGRVRDLVGVDNEDVK